MKHGLNIYKIDYAALGIALEDILQEDLFHELASVRSESSCSRMNLIADGLHSSATSAVHRVHWEILMNSRLQLTNEHMSAFSDDSQHLCAVGGKPDTQMSLDLR